jgi:hypothetical protein
MRINPGRYAAPIDEIPPPPRLPSFPSPRPQPDEYALRDEFRDLRLRVDRVEERLAALFKKSVLTIIASDVLVSLVKHFLPQ